MEESVKKVLQSLQGRCARREYCVSEVRGKALKALEGDAEAADEVVAALVRDGFVDDLRYASAFAREKASLTGWGAVKISFALSGKGIARDVIAQALAEIDSDKASDKLDRLLAAKFRTLQSDPQCKLKLLKFALGRGYSYDEVAPAVERTLKGE